MQSDHRAGDAYDYHSPGFVPNEFNSLRLSEFGRANSLEQLERVRQGIRQVLRGLPFPYMADTDVILYDGELYIVGGYIRHLMDETGG